MRINVGKKGKAGERELCAWLDEHLDIQAKRNLDQTREGGVDVITEWFCFEVKRVENLSVLTAWNQCVHGTRAHNDENGENVNKEPVLAHRQNHKPWSFAVSAKIIGLENGYVTMTERVFRMWAEKHMGEFGI